MSITPAASPQEIEALRALFREYAASLPYDLGYQGFEAELAALPGSYAEPRGCLLLGRDSKESAGCVALRPFDDDRCEMKRLYVRPRFQGRGHGRALAERVIAEANTRNYRSMLLDTLASMTSAIRLYESLGFVRRDAYYKTPIAETVFMELALR